MANRYMKRCSALLITTEGNITAAMRHHHTPVRMANQRLEITNIDEVERREPCALVGM